MGRQVWLVSNKKAYMNDVHFELKFWIWRQSWKESEEGSRKNHWKDWGKRL